MLVAASDVWSQDQVWVCPMDPDVRSNTPGFCPRCGMKLADKIPEAVEYHMELSTVPRALEPGQPVQLTFAIHDPWKGRPSRNSRSCMRSSSTCS